MAKKDYAIGQRPGADAERWIQRGDKRTATTPPKSEVYSARLTVDVTPELRARIKVAAIAANVTTTGLLRAVLEREFSAAEHPQ